jgi:hypothetical protein
MSVIKNRKKAGKQESRKAGKQESRKAGKQESRKAGRVCGILNIKKPS